MEIKATLNKPFDQFQKNDFIITNNRQLGYEIRETIEALEAWGLTDEEKLIEAKANKQQENINACNNKRYNQSFTIELQEDKLCEFDTSEQTQRDLLTAGGVTSRDLTYQGWICNNGTEINLTEEDIQAIFQQFFMMVSPLYAIEKRYSDAIEACTTVEEVNAIELNYEINEDIEPVENEV